MRDLYFCGDIHGEFRELIWTVLEKYKIVNSDIIILGDFGVGFDKSLEHEYKRIEHRLERADVTIHVLRGNHDDPEYFIDENKYSLPRLKFLEDHKIYKICDRDIYTIGGACSTDITWRLEYNKNHKKKIWWEYEDIVEKYDDLPNKADIIISHEAPLSFEPIVTKLEETPLEQYEKIIKSRKYLDYIRKEINADYWFYGHHHKSYSGSMGKLLYKGLNIMEIYMAPEKIEHNPQGKIGE